MKVKKLASLQGEMCAPNLGSYTLVNFGCTKPVLLGTEMKVCTKHILISTPLYQGRLVHGVPEVY